MSVLSFSKSLRVVLPINVLSGLLSCKEGSFGLECWLLRACWGGVVLWGWELLVGVGSWVGLGEEYWMSGTACLSLKSLAVKFEV